MKCLVCAGEASDRTPRNFDGYVIECPSCGNYEVASGAWERFRNASKQEWAAALAKDGRPSRAPRFDPEKRSRWDAVQGSGCLQRSTRSASGTERTFARSRLHVSF
jgi:hypothetical protein